MQSQRSAIDVVRRSGSARRNVIRSVDVGRSPTYLAARKPRRGVEWLALTLGLAVSATSAQTMYWTDAGGPGGGRIRRAQLNGSNAEDVVAAVSPFGIAIDPGARKVYWTDIATKKIQRSNLDGTNVEDIVAGLNSPTAIALDLSARKMYWFDTGEIDKIQRANLDGSAVEDLVTG